MLGTACIGVMLWLGLSAPASGCGPAPTAPVMAFQIVRTGAELAALFGTAPSACRTILVEGLRFGNWADVLIFIPVYGAFLAAFAFALRGLSREMRLFLAASLFATIAGDVAETATQLRILENVDLGIPWLGALAMGNGIKTLGLSLFLIGIALALCSRPANTARVAALLLALLAALRLAGMAVDDLRPVAPLSALAAFSILWLYAAWKWAEGRAQRPASP